MSNPVRRVAVTGKETPTVAPAGVIVTPVPNRVAPELSFHSPDLKQEPMTPTNTILRPSCFGQLDGLIIGAMLLTITPSTLGMEARDMNPPKADWPFGTASVISDNLPDDFLLPV